MAENVVRQRLAAILAADVAGYSRLMGDDEPATIAAINRCRAVFRERIEAEGGRVVDMAGDSVLAVFDTAIGAFTTAIAAQERLSDLNSDVGEDRRMLWRTGVNTGDIHEQDDGTVYGDGVNVAARLEALAEPGGICVSGKVHDELRGKIDQDFADIGEHTVKNIAEPIRAFRVLAEGEAARPPARTRRPLMTAAAVAVVAMAGIVAWQISRDGGSEEVTVADPILALPEGPTIAVLPFENVSEDAGQDYFATGLTEDLITRLSQFSQLFVIARNSTAQYAGQAVDVRDVGSDLGARYVVEGSVRKESNAVRITVQLLDAENGSHMWAETYNRDLTVASVFEIQDEITEKISATIGDAWGVLYRADIDAIRDKPTESLDAYECTLRTLSYYDRIGPAEHAEVRDCLERAVASDPGYAEAWASLAEVYIDEHRFGFNPRPDPLDRALHAAETAIRLDRQLQIAHWATADVHFYRHEMAAFSSAAERTIARNPNNATALAVMGDRFIWAGDLERGMAMLMKATALNPYHPGWYYYGQFLYHFQDGDDQAALDMALKANMPEHFATHMLLAVGHARLGQLDQARAAADRLLEVFPSYPEIARQHLRDWNMSEDHIVRFIDALRKAGLDIADEAPLTD